MKRFLFNFQPKNEYEIRVFAIRRSGHHAFIQWIARQFDKPIYFMNSCEPFKNPFYNFTPPPDLDDNKEKNKYFMPIKPVIEDGTESWWNKGKQIAYGNYPWWMVDKGCLLYNYESFNIKLIRNRDVVPPYVNMGRSNKFNQILFMRDPYNMIASYIVWDQVKYVVPIEDRLKVYHNFFIEILELWKDYAREYLNVTNFLKDKVGVNYNKWLVDSFYRHEIINILDLPNEDRGIPNIVTINGGGSSFDKFKYDGKVKDMKVLERWKIFADNKDYTNLFDDEVKELSGRIFGETCLH